MISFSNRSTLYFFDKKYAADRPEIPEPITAIFINKNYAASSLYSSIEGHEQTRFLSP